MLRSAVWPQVRAGGQAQGGVVGALAGWPAGCLPPFLCLWKKLLPDLPGVPHDCLGAASPALQVPAHLQAESDPRGTAGQRERGPCLICRVQPLPHWGPLPRLLSGKFGGCTGFRAQSGLQGQALPL